MKQSTDPDESDHFEIPIASEADDHGSYQPEHMVRLRELLARLRASNRSAMILVDGKRGTIQIWNAIPAGILTIR